MESPSPLIDAAARPFGDDAEMCFATRELLGQRMDPAHPGQEETLRRWEKADTRRHPAPWKAILITIALFISSWLCLDHGLEGLRFYGAYRTFDWRNGQAPEFLQRLEPAPPTGLTDQERYLLGDKNLTPLENAHRLWMTDPDNPAYFARYTTAYISENRSLPDDYLETARRLDPDNSWFLYQAAGHLAKDTVKRSPQTYQQRKAKERKTWEITDETKFQESLALFREAARLPRFESYETANMMAQRSLLPMETPLQQYRAILHTAMDATGILSLRSLPDIAIAEAQRLEKSGDHTGFAAHLADCEAFIHALGRPDETYLIHGLIHFVSATTLAEQLDASARALDPSAVTEPWAGWSQKLTERKDKLRTSPGFDPSHLPDTSLRGGVIAQMLPMLARQVEHAPPISLEELAPTRELEHSIFSRAATVAALLITGLLLILTLFSRWLNRRLIRKLSARMEQLLGPGDWAWILGLGVLFPCSYVLVLQHFTPFGLRDFGLPYLGLRATLYPHLLIVLLSLCGAITVAAWRVRFRLAVFGHPSSVLRLAWPAMCSIGLLLPLIGKVSQHPSVQTFNTWLSSTLKYEISAQDLVLALWVILLLALIISYVFPAGRNLITSVTVARTVPAALALSMLLMSATLPILRASETRLMHRDTLIFPSPDLPALTPYEAKVAAQLRKEIREILSAPAN